MDPSNEDELLSSKFETRDELLICVRGFYSNRGYALSILRSNPEKYVLLQCDRGGQYRNTHNISEDQRIKKTTSRLINCPFRLYGKKPEGGVWTIEIRNKSHNHKPSNDLSGHSSHRRLTGDEMRTVDHMCNSGIAPRQIISSLRQSNPNTQAIAKTIYNAKTKIQKCNLNGKSIIQALFEELGKVGFMYNILRDEVGHITHLFMADPRSVMLTKNFPNAFVMDCTYKTNKYEMPLLDIIGITSFNTSFYSAFVFLEKETTENYVWALQMFKKIFGEENQPSVFITDRELALMNAIKVVFPSVPSILCVWHINKNILGKCKKFFKTQKGWDEFLLDWKDIVYSLCEDEYNHNLCKFESKYKEKKVALQYIKKTWLPLKEKFIGAWTEKHLHLGNRASSRAEGAHAKLKKYLQVSTGNLQNVKKKICLAVENEFNEIRVQLAREKIHVPHACNIPFFKNLIFRISLFALRELHKQYEMAKRGTMNPSCTGQFMATMGMPCAHQMRNWKIGSLSLDQVHPQWRIDTRELNDLNSDLIADPNEEMKILLDDFYREYIKWPLHKKNLARGKIKELLNQPDVLFEPTISSNKNRFRALKKRKAMNSTRRDPSQFEIAEAAWQCSSSNRDTDDQRNLTSHDTPEFEVPTTIADDGVFDWIDSNM